MVPTEATRAAAVLATHRGVAAHEEGVSRDGHPRATTRNAGASRARLAWPTLVAVRARIGHPSFMHARANESSPIPSAPFDDLDLDRPEDEEEWDRRVMALAAARIAAERVRLQRLGIVDANGDLVSRELPPDMLPEADTTLETG